MPFPFAFPFAFDYAGMWLEGWHHRIKYTIDHTRIDSTLTHFPVMLRISASCGADADDMTQVFDEVGSNSLKIAVTTANGGQLYVEIEKWDDTGEEAILWVSKAGWEIAADRDTILYIYYDAEHVDNTDFVGEVGSRTEVWDTHFRLVDHMRNGADTSHTIDSTANGNNGVKSGAGAPEEATGKVGEGQDFEYDNSHYIGYGDDTSLDITSQLSIEAVVRPEKVDIDDMAVVGRDDATNQNYGLMIDKNGVLGAYIYINDAVKSGTGTSGDIIAGNWYHVAGTYDGSYVRSYINAMAGGNEGSASGNIDNDDVAFYAGARQDAAPVNQDYFDGIIDEVRVSDTARSNAWLKATYYTCWDELGSFSLESGVKAEFILRAAFHNDPLDSVISWSDISSDLISFSIKRGRQHQLDRFESGAAVILLKNADGYYWPKNASGPYYPDVKGRRKINISAIYRGTKYDIFTGFIQRIRPRWLEPQARLIPCMELHLADLQRIIAGKKLYDDTGYSTEISGTRINNVLDDVGVPASPRDVDTGQETIIATGAISNVNAMQHLYDIQKSELSLLFIGPDGTPVYHDRHARTQSPYDTSQAIFGDGNIPVHAIEFSDDDELLYNEIHGTRVSGSEQVTSDSTSIQENGPRTLAHTGLLLEHDIMVLARCYYLLARYKDGQMRVKSIELIPQTPGYESALWPKILDYDISTRITVVVNEANINAEYFIEGIEHNWDYREGLYRAKWQLSDAAWYHSTPIGTMTQDLLPVADTGEKNINYSTETSHYEAVDEDPHDSDASYVANDDDETAFELDFYEMDSPAYTQGDIDKVTVKATVWSAQDYATGGYAKLALKSGNTTDDSDAQQINTSIPVEITHDWATNPDTSQPWIWSEINSLQAGVSLKAAIGSTLTQDLYPDDEGDETNILGSIPATHWQAVDETPHDWATTMVYSNLLEYRRDLYKIPVPGDTTGTISKIRVTAVFFLTNIDNLMWPAHCRIAIKTGGTVYQGTVYNYNDMGCHIEYDEWEENPNTSSAWTWNDIENLQIGINIYAGTTTEMGALQICCTQVYVTVYSNPPDEMACTQVKATVQFNPPDW